MKEIITKLLEQGLPTLLAILSVILLGLGFFQIETITPLKYEPKIYPPLIVIALVILSLAIGLWLIDKKTKEDTNTPDIDIEDEISGHTVLIRLLKKYSDKIRPCPPSEPEFINIVAKGDSNEIAMRAARYGSMYLQSLGLLSSKGGRFEATKKAQTLLISHEFRTKNQDAYHD
jgi:hypothetical protein